jgi:hypothetical protein
VPTARLVIGTKS